MWCLACLALLPSRDKKHTYEAGCLYVRPKVVSRVVGLLAFAFLVACGSSSSNEDMPDAGVDDAGNLLVDAAVPNPNGLVNVPLSCQPYSREVRHVATDGSRDVTIELYATTDLVAGDDFVITVCAPIVAPTCSSGDVCTGSTMPPISSSCIVTRGDGAFFDGKLVIHCGTRTERYASSGALLSMTQTNYTTKLERF